MKQLKATKTLSLQNKGIGENQKQQKGYNINVLREA
jgi:hypothetical protein